MLFAAIHIINMCVIQIYAENRFTFPMRGELRRLEMAYQDAIYCLFLLIN